MINAQNTITVTEARQRIFEITEDVANNGSYYVFSQKGKPAAVLMSAEEYDSWQETMEIMSDPELVKAIKDAEEDYKNGNYISLDEFLENEKAIQNRTFKKSSKIINKA